MRIRENRKINREERVNQLRFWFQKIENKEEKREEGEKEREERKKRQIKKAKTERSREKLKDLERKRNLDEGTRKRGKARGESHLEI